MSLSVVLINLFLLVLKAAQQRREDKVRAEKERIMQEDDPERQRRLEVSTLLAKNFGRFLFRTKKCPKIKQSEIFKRPKFKASENFTIQ